MFSLVLTVIGIALVAVLALATLYYGSDALTRGADRAKVAKVLNEGQQIQGALVLYQTE